MVHPKQQAKAGPALSESVNSVLPLLGEGHQLPLVKTRSLSEVIVPSSKHGCGMAQFPEKSVFLKNGGHCVISVMANCIDSTAPAEHVFAHEVTKLQAEQFKPLEQLTLEPYERDHAMVVACYRPAADKKK